MEVGESNLSTSSNRSMSEAAELASLKDEITMTPASTSSSDSIALSIKCPSLTDVAAESTLLLVHSQSSIAQVKSQIEGSWSGRPLAQGMRMFKSGQILTDDMIVGNIVPPNDRTEPAPIHLVIRPTAWSEPRPSMTHRQPSNRAARPPPSPHEAWVESSSSAAAKHLHPPQIPIPAMHIPQRSRHGRLKAQDYQLASVIEKMDPSNYASFRSLLGWSYYKYVDLYETRWREVYGNMSKAPIEGSTETSQSVEELAKGMNCTNEEVLAAVQMVESDVLLWKPLEEEISQTVTSQGGLTYRTVTLQGLPYLLQVKHDLRSRRLEPLLSRIKRLQDIIHRMDKLINYQNLFDQASNTSLLQANMRRSQAALLAATAGNGGVMGNNNVGGAAAGARTVRFRVVLNMSDFFSVAVPAFFMSLKMTLLVYIFTRGATTLKTCLIAGAGIVFVILEAWKTAHRENERRRQAALRERERRNGPTPNRGGSTSATTANQSSNAETVVEDESNMESLRPRMLIRHRNPSPFTVDYWVETLAYINLSSEESEFGWHPLPTNRRRTAAAPQSNRLVKMVYDFILLPALLMIVTLVPEIEQKRRKALDQREELIRSTAKKVEERKARLVEREKEKREKGEGIEEVASPSQFEEIPSYLKHPYCQRIINQRRTGRQIDIAQELEAAAAAGEGQGADQADMGFL